MSRREAWLSASGIFLAALVVRAWAAAHVPFPIPEDATYYWGVARNLADGHGLVSTMRRALSEAGIRPGDVDVVHAQGLSLPEYDAMELRCFSETFEPEGKRPHVAAISSWTGNSLGALGAVQGAGSLLMLDRQTIPSIANTQSLPDAYPANIVRKTLTGERAEIVLQTSYCFLGKSSTLIFKRWHP